MLPLFARLGAPLMLWVQLQLFLSLLAHLEIKIAAIPKSANHVNSTFDINFVSHVRPGHAARRHLLWKDAFRHNQTCTAAEID